MVPVRLHMVTIIGTIHTGTAVPVLCIVPSILEAGYRSRADNMFGTQVPVLVYSTIDSTDSSSYWLIH